MYRDLTKGPIGPGLVRFALPMMLGNLLQQIYNLADTLIAGRALGRDALAAIGSAYTLMTFLTSIFIGLSLGAGALFSIYFGKREQEKLQSAVGHGLVLVLGVTLVLTAASYAGLDVILRFLQVPSSLRAAMRGYLLVVFAGLLATAVYNFLACLLRALGNSAAPLWFLGAAAVGNVLLDLLFVLVFSWGIVGTAVATVLCQYLAAIGLTWYTLRHCSRALPRRLRYDGGMMRRLGGFSALTCLQQAAMNFGILLIQRLVDSFGPVVMAAFAAAVKIDTLAYLPVQDFGNAFSTFAAQNYGAGQQARLRDGMRTATAMSAGFSLAASVLVVALARPLLQIFIPASQTEVLACGVQYLRIEGAFYVGIGCLFLLYGFYRAIDRPAMSLVLTVISLGTRVALAYLLAGPVGPAGIWLAIPIGWFLADVFGYGVYFRLRRGREKAV